MRVFTCQLRRLGRRDRRGPHLRAHKEAWVAGWISWLAGSELITTRAKWGSWRTWAAGRALPLDMSASRAALASIAAGAGGWE